MKTVAKAAIIISGVLILASVVFMSSFNNSRLPQKSQLETGRIIPFTHRGSLMGYVTHSEKVQYELSLGACVVFILIAASTDYYLDPFNRRKQRWKSR